MAVRTTHHQHTGLHTQQQALIALLVTTAVICHGVSATDAAVITDCHPLDSGGAVQVSCVFSESD